ncbi:MAG: exodeoxyribonuclease VII small subunit [Rhodanobacteraceae bacterium]
MPKPAPKPETVAPEGSPVAQFEQSLTELEALVARMESGELSLDASLRSFERGVALYRSCQAALEQADARVKLLLDPEHPESAQPFSPDEEA